MQVDAKIALPARLPLPQQLLQQLHFPLVPHPNAPVAKPERFQRLAPQMDAQTALLAHMPYQETPFAQLAI